MEEQEIHLRDYLKVVLKRRYMVVTFFIVVFVTTVIGTFSARPAYQATTKVLIEKTEPKSIPSLSYFYSSYDPEFKETQNQLIKSPSVAKRVVDMLSLDKTYETYVKDTGQSSNILQGTVQWVKDLISVIVHVGGAEEEYENKESSDTSGTQKPLSKADMLAKMISGSIIVTPIKDSKLVNISYMSRNPELASLIVNSVANAYIDELLEMKMTSSSYAIEWLTKKADEEREKLEKSDKALQEYKREYDIVTLENRLAIVPEKLTEVATKIAEAETKRKAMESLYNRVRTIKDPDKADTIPSIGSDPTVQSLRGQILKAEQKIMDMSKKYGEKHPAMKTAQSDLTILKEKKIQEIKRVIETIKNEYELARMNEENFRKLAVETKAETLNISEKFMQYESLKRENETNRQLFDAILKKIKEEGITQDIQTVNVWVVEKASVPESPSKPNKPLNILLGLLVGIFGGIGLAFFVEYLDNTIKSPEDAETKLGIPVLGTIQLYEDGKIENIIVDNPQSVVVEAYKAIRTSVLLSSAEKPPKSILVTSIEPSEGKTVTAVNLAQTIAQSESSVLLVDADLRKSVIHKIFNLDNTKGLSTYLAGASDDDIIINGPIKNLYIIPAGPIPPNPSELLGSVKMAELVKKLYERFDIIVFDSAPVLAVSDSVILSKIVESSLLVSYAGKTTYDGFSRGLRLLKDVNSHIIGMVINAVDIKKGGYSYYYKYYHYDYNYSSDTAQKK
jgi:capsular exopolysaccharide synthesis family protein